MDDDSRIASRYGFLRSPKLDMTDEEIAAMFAAIRTRQRERLAVFVGGPGPIGPLSSDDDDVLTVWDMEAEA